MLVPELLAACEKVYDSPTFVAPNGYDAFLYSRTDTYQIIAPRGTLVSGYKVLSDWYNDLHAFLVVDAAFPGRVHEGFVRSAHIMYGNIPSLAKVPLFITGHSKGGAVALALAWMFRMLHPVVVTFGAPRFCNAECAAQLNWLPVFRYENSHDLVPKLPPIGYCPVGAQIISPVSFKGSFSIESNHELETGYKPWVKEMLCGGHSVS